MQTAISETYLHKLKRSPSGDLRRHSYALSHELRTPPYKPKTASTLTTTVAHMSKSKNFTGIPYSSTASKDDITPSTTTGASRDDNFMADTSNNSILSYFNLTKYNDLLEITINNKKKFCFNLLFKHELNEVYVKNIIIDLSPIQNFHIKPKTIRKLLENNIITKFYRPISTVPKSFRTPDDMSPSPSSRHEEGPREIDLSRPQIPQSNNSPVKPSTITITYNSSANLDIDLLGTIQTLKIQDTKSSIDTCESYTTTSTITYNANSPLHIDLSNSIQLPQINSSQPFTPTYTNPITNTVAPILDYIEDIKLNENTQIIYPIECHHNNTYKCLCLKSHDIKLCKFRENIIPIDLFANLSVLLENSKMYFIPCPDIKSHYKNIIKFNRSMFANITFNHFEYSNELIENTKEDLIYSVVYAKKCPKFHVKINNIATYVLISTYTDIPELYKIQNEEFLCPSTIVTGIYMATKHLKLDILDEKNKWIQKGNYTFILCPTTIKKPHIKETIDVNVCIITDIQSSIKSDNNPILNDIEKLNDIQSPNALDFLNEEKQYYDHFSCWPLITDPGFFNENNKISALIDIKDDLRDCSGIVLFR